MSKRVVFNVNILISAMLSTTGAPAQALASALDEDWATDDSFAELFATYVDVRRCTIVDSS